MNTTEFSEQFIDRIAILPRLFVSKKTWGLVTSFPVIGGRGYIMIAAGDMTVRLVHSSEM